MKRSKYVRLSLVTSVAALFIGCRPKPQQVCVDQNQNVVDNHYCQQNPSIFYPSGQPAMQAQPLYRWYYIPNPSSAGYPLGEYVSGGTYSAPEAYSSSVTSNGRATVVRGGFGSTGEAFGGGGDE